MISFAIAEVAHKALKDTFGDTISIEGAYAFIPKSDCYIVACEKDSRAAKEWIEAIKKNPTINFRYGNDIYEIPVKVVIDDNSAELL